MRNVTARILYAQSSYAVSSARRNRNVIGDVPYLYHIKNATGGLPSGKPY